MWEGYRNNIENEAALTTIFVFICLSSFNSLATVITTIVYYRMNKSNNDKVRGLRILVWFEVIDIILEIIVVILA